MKIPVKNLYVLLCYAWDVLDEASDDFSGVIEEPAGLNLLASIFVRAVDRRMRPGKSS